MTTNDTPARKQHARRVLTNIAKTAVALLVGAGLCELLYRLGTDQQNIIIVMVLAVFITSAITDGYFYGLAAALVGVFVYDFMVTEPRHGFSITLGFPITLSIMLLVTIVTSTITTRLKNRMRAAQAKEQRAELLYSVNRTLLSSRDVASIARQAMEFLWQDLNRSVVLYAPILHEEGSPSFFFRQAEGDATFNFFSSETEWAAAKLAATRGEPVAVGEAGPEGTGTYYLPVVAQGEVYGVLGISCRQGPIPLSHMPFVELIVEQTGQALHVQALAARQQESMVLAETEKTRNRFLRAVSHDLRTPLTSIIGASATFLESRDELSQETQGQLVEGILTDSQWLLSMVENILSVTRIQQNDMSLEKTEETAEGVVGEAVSLFRRRHPDADITVRQTEELPLVPMDALLITQVLNNLLDNAQRHTGEGVPKVVIDLQEVDGYVRFSVIDDGPGIDEDLLPRLFKLRPTRRENAEDSGLGIGLGICKAIVDAHGGWIRAQNMPKGGARFMFALPLSEDVLEED